MKRRAFLAVGAGCGISSLAGCSALGEEEHGKPVDRARVMQDFESSMEDEELEVVRTFSDWYGGSRDYRVWYVTEGDPEPLPSEMAVIAKAYAESIPSHDYAGGLLASSWPDAEQEGDRWDFYIETEWVNQDIDEETFIERIEETLSQQGTA